jgi:nucleotide-binding universal stress UspA family protein
VHCWEYPYLGVIDFVGMDERIRSTSHDGAEALLDATITRLRDAHPDDDVTLTPMLLEGNPAWSILEAAKGADLIVVGSRGRSGLKTLLLGSVSHVVVTHADIPVVVVRHAARTHAGGE